MKRLLGFAALFALLSVAACEKSGTETKSSGPLDEKEEALLSHIPAGANLVFGGNYQKLIEYWETSPLKTLSELAMMTGNQDQSDKLRNYMTCWVEQKKATQLAGSMEFSGASISMTMVFRGLDEKTLTRCADVGGYKYEKDDNYIEIQGVPTGVGTQTTNVGYYFIDPETVFFAMEAPIGMAAGGSLPMPSQSELKAKLEAAKKSPATKDDSFKKLVAKADRSKPFWFSASAEGTPLAGQMGIGHGWLDADKSSLTIGFSVELASASVASNAVEQFESAKDNLGMLPPDLKEAIEDFLDDAKLSSKGKVLNGRFRITNKMLDKALPTLKQLMPMAQ